MSDDERSRKERRADPDRWFEIVSYFQEGEEGRYLDVEGQQLFVRGNIDDVIVVQVPAHYGSQQAHQIMGAVQRTMQGAGVDRPLVLMPDDVKLMKVRPVSKKRSMELSRQQKMNEARARARAQAEAEKNENSDDGNETIH